MKAIDQQSILRGKRFFLFILFALLACASNGFGQTHGKILESLKFESKILKESVSYSIYLPSDYDQSKRAYPVVYLLHGYGDNETAWTRFGQIQHYADEAIAAGKIVPMIIVMPSAKLTWYMNDYQNKVRYEDMFFEELIPQMQKEYRIIPEKEFRGIAGLSMGGFGTMLYALKHPSYFAACAPLSAAILTADTVRSFDQKTFEEWFPNLYCGRVEKPEDRLGSHWHNNNILEIVKNKPDEQLNKVKYYIDCGDDDYLISGNCDLHLMLKKKGVKHEFRVRDGEHNWTYWRSGITDALEFISQSFGR